MVIQALALKTKGEGIGVSLPSSTGIWVLSWGKVVQAGERVPGSRSQLVPAPGRMLPHPSTRWDRGC